MREESRNVGEGRYNKLNKKVEIKGWKRGVEGRESKG